MLTRLKDIYLDDPIEDKKAQLCEYFVKFYGEKHRASIEKKFKNINYIYVYITDNKLLTSFAYNFLLPLKQENANQDQLQTKQMLQDYRDFFEYFKKKECESCIIRENKKRYLGDYLKTTFKFSDSSQLEDLVIKFEYIIKNSSQLERDNFKAQLMKFIDLKQEPLFNQKFKKIMLPKNIEILSNKMKEYDEKIEDAALKYLIANYTQYIDPNNITNEAIYNWLMPVLKGEASFFATMVPVFNLKSGKMSSNIFLRDLRMLDDNYIVHETNHAISSNVVRCGNSVSIKHGVKESVSLIKYKNEFPELVTIKGEEEYRALNEIINDYLTEKIMQNIKKDGFEISLLNKSVSMYAHVTSLYSQFFDKHLDQIKERYISNDSRSFEKYFGKENFAKLASVTTKLLNFTLKQSKLPDDQLKCKNSMSKTYLNLIHESQKIISDIEEYISAQQTNNNLKVNGNE